MLCKLFVQIHCTKLLNLVKYESMDGNEHILGSSTELKLKDTLDFLSSDEKHLCENVGGGQRNTYLREQTRITCTTALEYPKQNKVCNISVL